jgi:hypothetical protein
MEDKVKRGESAAKWFLVGNSCRCLILLREATCHPLDKEVSN